MIVCLKHIHMYIVKGNIDYLGAVGGVKSFFDASNFFFFLVVEPLRSRYSPPLIPFVPSFFLRWKKRVFLSATTHFFCLPLSPVFVVGWWAGADIVAWKPFVWGRRTRSTRPTRRGRWRCSGGLKLQSPSN